MPVLPAGPLADTEHVHGRLRLVIWVTGIALALAAALPAEQNHELTGYASWYAGKFQGRLTANGEVFDTNQLTAAHRTLPFGTIVDVEHLGNGLTVRVRINDRGPFIDGRVIDLSRSAADSIRMTAEGVARVRITVVAGPPPERRVVQVGSFDGRANADRVVESLRRAGMDARIEEGPGVWRVVVGPMPEHAVDAARTRLAALGYANVLVRRP